METRLTLLQLLKNYQPLHSEDQSQLEKIREFVAAHDQCFERTFLKGHITGSAWVVDETGQKVLLTHHKKLNKWLQLGGHADGDGDVWAVALREAQEESGLKNFKPVSNEIFDVDVHIIPERKNEPEHFHYDIRFAFQTNASTPLKISHESRQLAWVPLTDLEHYTAEASMLRMRQKWRAIRPITH